MDRTRHMKARARHRAPHPGEDMLARVSEDIAVATGERFFDTLTARLAAALGADCCYVGEYLAGPPPAVRTVAVSSRGAPWPNLSYALAGTPCALVVEGGTRCFPTGMQTLFPGWQVFSEPGIDSYIGAPLNASDGTPLGILVVLHAAPLPDPALAARMLNIFAVRAASELERQRQEQALRHSEVRYRAVFEHSGEGIAILRDGRFVDCNEASLQLYRCDRSTLLGKSPFDISPPIQPGGRRSVDLTLDHLANAAGNGGLRFEWVHRRFDGSEFDAEVVLSPISIEGISHFVATVRDVTARKQAALALLDSTRQLEASHATLRAIHVLSRRLNDCTDDQLIARETLITVTGLADSPVGIFMREDRAAQRLVVMAQMDLQQGLLREHPGYLPLEDSLSGMCVKSGQVVFAEDYCNDPRISPELRERARLDNCHSSVAIPLIDGGETIGCLALDYRMPITGNRQRLEDFATIGATVSLALINARHRKQLEFRALHDGLTDLPNRQVLHQSFAARTVMHGALMLLDLDRFKEINDTLGHGIGDRLLREIGPRLYAALGHHESLLCRLGGDEFTLLVPGVDTREASLQLGFELLDALRQPFAIDGMQLEIGGSIGIALYPQDGNDSHALLRSADVAMYAAKQSGAGVLVYDRLFDRHTPERLAMVTEFGQALREQQLLLHYQPRLDLRDMTVVGFEALVRWEHPRLGFLMPQDFMPLLEMSDGIHGLTTAVMDMAVATLLQWPTTPRALAVSINLSARNLVDDRCMQYLRGLIARHALPPGAIELEITETTLMHDPEGARELLAAIAAEGVSLSIDDYGTGYSSLAYLRRLPIRALKIDRAFVRDMRTDEHDAIIVHSTINLAHNLGLQVVAEGVEDLQTLALLRQMGCDQAQGCCIAQAMPADDVRAWLINFRPPIIEG